MSCEQLRELYENPDSINISMLFDLIDGADSKEEKSFYADFLNIILKLRQKECIADGRF